MQGSLDEVPQARNKGSALDLSDTAPTVKCTLAVMATMMI